MTMNEVNEKLTRELSEEMNSAVDYHQMSIAMDAEGCKESVFLMEIAKEEMTHAKWIHDYLAEKRIPISSDLERRYSELSAAHKF